MGERKRETVKEREREREGGGVRESEKDEESMRIGNERKSPLKTDVPKLYAYNECEHSVIRVDLVFKIFAPSILFLVYHCHKGICFPSM